MAHSTIAKKLNVEEIIFPRIFNYNNEALKCLSEISTLLPLNSTVCFETPFGKDCTSIELIALNRGTYSASIFIKPVKSRPLRLAFPFLIMFGSNLDFLFRIVGLKHVNLKLLTSANSLISYEEIYINNHVDFNPFMRVFTCFLVLGLLKQIPLFLSNNPSRFHLTKVNTIRRFIYDYEGKGTKIEYHFKEKNIVLSDSKGNHLKCCFSCLSKKKQNYIRCPSCVLFSAEITRLFCKSETLSLNSLETIKSLDLYFKYLSNSLPGNNIDHLGNKICVEPGQFLNLILRKDVYPLIKEWANQDFKKFSTAKFKIISKGVLNGKGFLHTLSLKTRFSGESSSCSKKTKLTGRQFSSISSSNEKSLGENGMVFLEKQSTVYSSVQTSSFQLIPFLASSAKRCLSDKVKDNRALAFNKSAVAFLCPLYTSESKNIGRSVALCRNVFSSSSDCCKLLEKTLKTYIDNYPFTNDLVNTTDCLLIYNDRPILIGLSCFEEIEKDLYKFKHSFKFIEAFADKRYNEVYTIHISFKPFTLFKRITIDLYATPNELDYWLHRIFGANLEQFINKDYEGSLLNGFDFVSSWFTLFFSHSQHNLAQKNILFLNNLRNSVISPDSLLSRIFCEPISSFHRITSSHKQLFLPTSNLSKYYQVYVPKLCVLLSWAAGLNQEDCLVLNDQSLFAKEAFLTKEITARIDIKPFFSKIKNIYHFCKVTQNSLLFNALPICLGRLHEVNGNPFTCNTMTNGCYIKQINPSCAYVYYTKPYFQSLLRVDIVQQASAKFFTYELIITISKTMKIATGDKLCSFSGQKGVIKLLSSSEIPEIYTSSGNLSLKPDIIMHPDSVLRRQTFGQFLEYGPPHTGYIKGSNEIFTSFSKVMFFYANFIEVNYRSQDHIYSAVNCTYDSVIEQPTKGSNRGGGMKIGNMEIRNCFIANGLSNTAHEMLFTNSDKIFYKDTMLTKALLLCNADANFYKCGYKLTRKSCVRVNPIKRIKSS